MQRTLSIIKPDAVSRNLCGEILVAIEAAGLKVIGIKMLRMTKTQAENFYAAHKKQPFFDSLTSYMSSGPSVCVVLEGQDAITRYRALMGATDHKQAAEGTLRKKYALSLQANSVHGSDAPESADFEISYFFSKMELEK